MGETTGCFERSLKISDKLALAYTNDIQAQRDLSISPGKLAMWSHERQRQDLGRLQPATSGSPSRTSRWQSTSTSSTASPPLSG